MKFKVQPQSSPNRAGTALATMARFAGIVCGALLAIVIASTALGADPAGAPDIVIADFEAETYGDWKTAGDAFGPGPARGTLPNQMAVTGYQGKGLVNSFYHGDNSTGTLT